jgi:hypothetical protein
VNETRVLRFPIAADARAVRVTLPSSPSVLPDDAAFRSASGSAAK